MRRIPAVSKAPRAERPARTDRGRAAAPVAFTLALAALLAVYLVVRNRPHVSSLPPAPPSPSPEVSSSGPVPSPAEQEARSRALREEAQALVRDGQSAMDGRRWAEALEKLGAADAALQKLPADPRRDAERTRVHGLFVDAQARQEEERRRERAGQYERRLAEVKKLDEETRLEPWEQALALAEGLRKDFPEKAGELADLVDRLRRKVEGANAYLLGQIEKADKAAAQGDFGAAFGELRRARRWKAQDARLDQASTRIRALFAERDMVGVPAGPFATGSSDPADANPARPAETKAFRIDRTEVTNEHYAWFCDDTGRAGPPTWKGSRQPADFASRPVAGVTADDAEAYARWVGKRLPTEEEWEKAARGTDGRTWPWGSAWPEKPVCVCAEARPAVASADSAPDAAPAGSLSGGESPFGAVDMAGNAWEWTATKAKLEDEPDVEGRVLKGGSFHCRRDGVRSARRYVERPDVRLRDVGFRCVKDP